MTLEKWLLLPLFIHVLLIAYIGVELLQRRRRAVNSGEVKLEDISANPWGWPYRVRKYGQNFTNQFETPMLWYGVCAIAVAVRQIDLVMVILSWVFLGSRFAHTFVQTGRNNVNSRFMAFLIGFAAVFAMWMWLATKYFLFGGSA
jgi:hypothetical protein